MRISFTNFTGGEVSRSLDARYDLSRYNNSLSCFENFLPNLHGAAMRRMGSYCIGELSKKSRILPFSFSANALQNFILIFSEYNLQVARSDELLNISLATPYRQEDLEQISYAQVGDIVYLAHSNYPLHKLMRSGAYPNYTWSFVPVVLNSSLQTPQVPSVAFSGENKNYSLRYKIVGVDANGKESLPSVAGSGLGKHPSDWVQGDYVTLSWAVLEGAYEYNIYREEAGYFGFIGVSQGTNFIDNNYEADISDTPKEDWNPFENDNNPGLVAFHQQRMVLGATRNSPQTFYLSRSGDFENFRKSRPLQADDPIEYQIASGAIDSITWAASFGDLLIGTTGAEYKVNSSSGALTATDVMITAQSYWGSSGLNPIIIGNSILHVQRHGAHVRDLFYSLEKDGYAGNDLSIMSPHLFNNFSLIQWAYQQNPNSNIWIVRDDGTLLCLTYMKEHDIWGFSRHTTQGKFMSACTISGQNEDILISVVEREINGQIRYFLERSAKYWTENDALSDAFYVDCGRTYYFENPNNELTGLNHLENMTVSILADGSPIEDLRVENGIINLPFKAKTVHVGLGYKSILSPLSPEGSLPSGTSLGLLRSYGRSSVRLCPGLGGKYGVDLQNMYDFAFVPQNWGESISPFYGDIEFIPLGTTNTQGSIMLMQDKALPFTISALSFEIDFSQNEQDAITQ